MKKSLLILALFFVSTLFSATGFAAQSARFQCIIKPPQADTFGFKSNWNGVVRWRKIVAGRGIWNEEPFRVNPDGFFVKGPFTRPYKRGVELEVVIRILGGPGYQDSSIYFRWEGGQEVPVVNGTRCNVWLNGVRGDDADYGAVFQMIRR